MHYSPSSQVGFMITQLKKGTVAKRPDSKPYTDKALMYPQIRRIKNKLRIYQR